MKTAELLQILIIIASCAMLIITFREYVRKKLLVALELFWSLFYIIMIITGFMPNCFSWTNCMGKRDVVVLFCLFMLFLLIVFYMSIILSVLAVKNQELAIQVSLINQENEQMLKKLHILPEGNGEE